MRTMDELRRIPELDAAPQVEWLSRPGPTRSFSFASEPWHGNETAVFGYLALPVHASEDAPLPAIVLVHGGGGRAFPEWATQWAQRGYVAIAMDLAGRGADGERHSRPGPDHDEVSKFRALEEGVRESWMFHAVAAVLHSVSLVRALPEVDPERVVMTGISWGAHVSEIATALDPRIRSSAFVYGGGFLRGNRELASELDLMPPELAETWTAEFDQSNYLADIAIPTLWVSGATDQFYSLGTFQRSFGLVRGPRTLRITPVFEHSHESGWSPLEICEFFDSQLKDALPLIVLGELELTNREVRAPLVATREVLGAQLHTTFDTGPWRERAWRSEPARVQADDVRAVLPPGPVAAAFITVTDVRGAVVSTQFVEPAVFAEPAESAVPRSGQVLVFIGDSITDDGRTSIADLPLGQGYVAFIADELARRGSSATVINAGISGDRVEALRRRWDSDALAHTPDVVTILIGINDTWRRYDSDDPTAAEAFEADYRRILERTRSTGAHLVLMEPFMLPIGAADESWREDLDPKIAVVDRLAAEFGATLIRADSAFGREAQTTAPEALLRDGVHPDDAGRALLAKLWLDAVPSVD